MNPQLITLLLALSAACVCWKSAPVFAAWHRARRSAAPIGLLTVWVMFFRNVPLDAVVDAHVSARKAGVAIHLREMIAHARAGGDVRAVVYAYIETLRAGTLIDFTRVCEIELDGEES